MATTLTVTEDEGVPVLVVVGELSQNVLQDFDERLDALTAEEGPAYVVDLVACPFITSLTVPCLLRGHDLARQKDRRFLIAAGEQLRMVLTVLRLEKRLNVRESREACLREAAADAASAAASAESSGEDSAGEGQDDEAAEGTLPDPE